MGARRVPLDAGSTDAGVAADGGVEDGLPDAAVPATGIVLVGRRLYVDGAPYEIRGVCWSPIPRGSRPPVDWSGRLAADDVARMAAAGINTVRVYSPIDDVGLLDALFDAGIRVIQDVYSAGNQDTATALAIVEAQREHPAILFWSLGNEWNYNGLYVGVPLSEVETRLEELAAQIKAIDPSHPVATSHGELPTPARLASMPSIDVWGLNVYRGSSFAGLIETWERTSDRAMFIAEYGADAYDSRTDMENRDAQATATRRLTEEWVARSAARYGSGAVLGGTIFEWSDEWWKDPGGSLDAHDTTGIDPGAGPPPDGVFNEEWWGLVDIDRNPRPALAEYTAALAD